MSAIIFQAQSLIIVALMLYGVSRVVKAKKERYRHVKIMKLVMIWDILLILQIELSRGAIMKASKVMENMVILNIHVSLAVATVLLYGLMAYTGKKVMGGDNTVLPKHKLLGRLTVCARLATLGTSFFVL